MNWSPPVQSVLDTTGNLFKEPFTIGVTPILLNILKNSSLNLMRQRTDEFEMNSF